MKTAATSLDAKAASTDSASPYGKSTSCGSAPEAESAHTPEMSCAADAPVVRMFECHDCRPSRGCPNSSKDSGICVRS